MTDYEILQKCIEELTDARSRQQQLIQEILAFQTEKEKFLKDKIVALDMPGSRFVIFWLSTF
jgi:hypothetical protein